MIPVINSFSHPIQQKLELTDSKLGKIDLDTQIFKGEDAKVHTQDILDRRGHSPVGPEGKEIPDLLGFGHWPIREL